MKQKRRENNNGQKKTRKEKLLGWVSFALIKALAL